MSSSLEISKTYFTHMCILEEKEREERQRKAERQREMTKREGETENERIFISGKSMMSSHYINLIVSQM